MKYFLIIIGLLVYFLLDWFSSSLKAETITTNNLVSTNFRDGSWNNPINTFHNDQTLAGHHGVEHTTSVTYSTDIDALNENGFTMNGGATIWHWYSSQTVMITQSITLDNGSVVSQTKNYDGARGLTQTVSNSIIVAPNVSTSYDLGLGINFADTRGAGHYSADVSNPFITLTYDTTVTPPLDETTLQDIQDINEVVKVEIPKQEIKIEETKPVEIVAVKSTEPIQTVTKTEPTIEQKIESKPVEPKPEIKEEPKKEQAKVEEKKEEPKEEVKKEATKEPTQQVVESKDKDKSDKPNNASPVVTSEKKSSSVSLSINKIDGKVISLNKIMELKSINILKAMTDNTMINAYSLPFYKSKKLYENQLSIADTKLLYTNNSLGVYISNDPVVKYQNALIDIRSEKQQLLNEIQVLRNG